MDSSFQSPKRAKPGMKMSYGKSATSRLDAPKHKNTWQSSVYVFQATLQKEKTTW